ncbi:MAG TPA: hypothetical protein VE687_04970 [Stellaceae bacterium]|nr:hypothetical protein [Stellaceae bacterium]
MRTQRIAFIAALAFAISFQTGHATPMFSGGKTIAATSPNVLPVKHHCGKGQRWVPAGYAAHGKYRAGHCAPV